jgi:uncharacterized protein (DUF1800 family)
MVSRSARVALMAIPAVTAWLILGSLLAAQVGSQIPGGDEAIVHALNRLTFGLRPGDVDRVRTIGLGRWIEQQLTPSQIKDDALRARLGQFKTLELDSGEIARDYFLPARDARRARKRAESDSDVQELAGAPGRRGRRRDMSAAGDAIGRDRQVIEELASAKIVRAVYSERQLEEVLVDFWFNHFNVFAGKGQTGIYITEYERDAIRPHVLGRFRDLLGATAKSPAMLFYLDNWLSTDPNVQRGRRPHPTATRRGLNENYARELLELHTLGVDGGYTQKDVVEVARAFTGWTLERPAGRGTRVQARHREIGEIGEKGLAPGSPRSPSAFASDGFRFVRPMHDRGAKNVLGRTIKAGGGIEDGEQVLDIVAAHPSTARHIASKLARRFVSDTPPAAVVDRAAKRFGDTGGDLREVVRTIVTSPEFFASEARRAKVKTPLEFVASALRATRADVSSTRPVLRALQQLGMPLYLCQPPTGYDDTAETWVSSGALVTRMNIALQIADGSLRGVSTPIGRERDLSRLRDELVRDAFGGDVSASTRATMEKASTAAQTIALAIGSPEFQRR